MKNLFSIIFLLLKFKQGLSESDTESINVDEISLTNFLLNKNYSANNRPTFQVDIFLTLRIKQLTNVDEKTQTIVTSSYLFLNWIDPRF